MIKNGGLQIFVCLAFFAFTTTLVLRKYPSRNVTTLEVSDCNFHLSEYLPQSVCIGFHSVGQQCARCVLFSRRPAVVEA